MITSAPNEPSFSLRLLYEISSVINAISPSYKPSSYAFISSIISNLGSVSNYLTSTSGNYQTGDKNANDSVTAVGNENGSRFGNFIKCNSSFFYGP